jgi:hypothetical protein
MRDRLICTQCHAIVHETAVLQARSPFCRDIIYGCPDCKAIDSFMLTCHECDKVAYAGWRDATGQNYCCKEHWDNLHATTEAA